MKMPKLRKRKSTHGMHHLSEIGTAPGTLTAHPDLLAQGIRLFVTAYDESSLLEKEITDIAEIPALLQKYPVTWLDITGLGDLHKLDKIAQLFNLHALAMEDVVNVHQRPKVEEYGDIMFAVTQMPSFKEEMIDLEQVSMFWSKNFVVTFQHYQGDCLDPLRNRIRHGGRRQRLLRAEYLAYAMLDTIVDSFFPILELLGTKLDTIEEDAITNPSSQIIVSVYDYKRDLLALRRALWSQREAIRNLSAIGKFADNEMRFYLRDCEDHTVQLIDILESYRERTSGLMDIYLSSLSNRMNQIMKVLTIMATIFMPLTVITGIYGMNFDREHAWNMPELDWAYGYPFALGLMVLTVCILLLFFWIKGWLRD